MDRSINQSIDVRHNHPPDRYWEKYGAASDWPCIVFHTCLQTCFIRCTLNLKTHFVPHSVPHFGLMTISSPPEPLNPPVELSYRDQFMTMSAIRKAFFFPTILYNVTMDAVRSRQWFNRIDQNVVLGAMPFRGSSLETLVKAENIKGIISMNEEFELNPYWYATEAELKALDVEFLNLPVGG